MAWWETATAAGGGGRRRRGGRRLVLGASAGGAAPRAGGEEQDLQNRPVRSNRRPPVAVYRTGLTGNRWKSVEFKSKFKSTCVTGSDRYTDRFDRFTGPV